MHHQQKFLVSLFVCHIMCWAVLFGGFQYILHFSVQVTVILFFCVNRRNLLEKKLADADVSEEDQNNLLKFLEKKETEYMRLQRHKMGADDFELLTMIGKGAFGEVKITENNMSILLIVACFG